MKAIIMLAAVLWVAPSAQAEDAWTRLRDVAGNASANELCWDTARNFAREKRPGGDAALTEVNLARAGAPNLVRESRKAFPGIRTC
jgi:hypothetical protein